LSCPEQPPPPGHLLRRTTPYRLRRVMSQLIGLIGKKRSGKDTFAHALPGYTRVAFADPLRQAALALDPFVPIQGTLARLHKWEQGLQAHDWVRLSKLIDAVGWETAKDRVPEVRRILQRLGTESIRAIDPDFWIRAGVTQIDAIDGDVVVTDVRYPNEAEAIRALGGILVRIQRPDLPSDGDPHPSESALDDYPVDWIVDNSGTVGDLQRAADDLVGYTA
jgi:hypothetical protein